MSYQNVWKNSGWMFSRCMPSIIEYLPQKFYFFSTEKPSSQQSEGKKKGREGNVRIHHRILVEEKRQERISRAIVRKDGRPTKMTSKWQVGSGDSVSNLARLICSAGPRQINCHRKSWCGRIVHMLLIREDDWGFFKSEQSWKWKGSKDSTQIRCLSPEARVREYSCL